MYEKFLEEVGNFIFMEDQPELADIIFVPGNSYPYMAEKAAEIYTAGAGTDGSSKWKIQYFFRKIFRSDWRNREI